MMQPPPIKSRGDVSTARTTFIFPKEFAKAKIPAVWGELSDSDDDEVDGGVDTM